VCDRWNLMKNLGDSVEAFLIRKRVRIPAEPLKEDLAQEELPQPAETTPRKRSHREELSQQRLRARQEICQQAKDLHEKGWRIHSIAKHLDRERTTIRKYLKVEGTWQPTPRQPGKSLLDPYRESILALWAQGCHNGQHILRTIQAQGYAGSATLLRAFVTQLRKQQPIKALAGSQASPAFRTIAKTPREIRWLLTKHRADLTD
jgi:hypothetical protein